MLQKIRKNLSYLDIHSKEVLKKSSATMIVRALGMILSFIVSIALGRLIGADGLGIINLSNRIVSILLMIALLGFPTVILKEVSIAFTKKDWNHVSSVINTSLKINGIIGLFIIIGTLLSVPFIVSKVFHEPDLKTPLIIAVVAMSFQIISRIYAAGVNGYRKVWQSSLVDNSLSLAVVLISIVIQYVLNYQITVVSVAWSYGIARVIVCCFMVMYWNTINHKAKTNSFIPNQLFKVALPLLFIQATSTISGNIDALMIGNFLSTREVGIYAVALRIAFASQFFLVVTNAVLAPKIASMYANGEISELEKLIQKTVKVLTIISIFTFIILVVFGRLFLNIWGEEFTSGYFSLVILSVGQLVNISVGSVGLILMLCGHEKIWGLYTFIATLLNIILNFFLIKFYDIEGAALATIITIILLNITAFILVKNRVGISTIKNI